MGGRVVKCFGYELLIDAYGCNGIVIDDLEHCYDFLEKAVDVLGVSQQSPPFIFHSPKKINGKDFSDKAGISGWIPLIESGIQIHTLTVKNFISVDYYTCSTIDFEVEKKLIDLVKKYFQPKKIDKELIFRGLGYYDR